MSERERTMESFAVYGIPRPQGSMALFRAKSGHEVAKYADTVYEWRGLCTVAARTARPDGPPLEGALRVNIAFDLPRPKSHFGTGRNAGVLKASAPQRPSVAPDLDKMIRAVLDAVTDAGVWWLDDGQVAVLSAAKAYCAVGEVPGATVWITELAAAPAVRLLTRLTS